jgi:hypothetical protein
MKSIEDKIIETNLEQEFDIGYLDSGIDFINNIKFYTNQRRMIYDVLSAKIGYVPIISIEK